MIRKKPLIGHSFPVNSSISSQFWSCKKGQEKIVRGSFRTFLEHVVLMVGLCVEGTLAEAVKRPIKSRQAIQSRAGGTLSFSLLLGGPNGDHRFALPTSHQAYLPQPPKLSTQIGQGGSSRVVATG
eukprot:2862823-Amphidinium_carterae.1